MVPDTYTTASYGGVSLIWGDWARPVCERPIINEKQLKIIANREWFLLFYERFTPIKAIVAVLSKAFSREPFVGRSITRQHKHRQVKNL